MLEQLEASLRALDTDHHRPLPDASARIPAFDQPDLWEMLSRQVWAGKIRHVGLSISPNDNLYQTAGATAVALKRSRWSTTGWTGRRKPRCCPPARRRTSACWRLPLASGLLTGKYRPGDVFDNPDDIRSQRSLSETQDALRQAAKIAATEVPPGVPMAAWALAWCSAIRPSPA